MEAESRVENKIIPLEIKLISQTMNIEHNKTYHTLTEVILDKNYFGQINMPETTIGQSYDQPQLPEKCKVWSNMAEYG